MDLVGLILLRMRPALIGPPYVGCRLYLPYQNLLLSGPVKFFVLFPAQMARKEVHSGSILTLTLALLPRQVP